MHIIQYTIREPKNFDAFGDFPSAADLLSYDPALPAYVSSPYHGHGAFVTTADALLHIHEFKIADHSDDPDTSCEIVYPIGNGLFSYIAAEPTPNLFTAANMPTITQTDKATVCALAFEHIPDCTAFNTDTGHATNAGGARHIHTSTPIYCANGITYRIPIFRAARGAYIEIFFPYSK